MRPEPARSPQSGVGEISVLLRAWSDGDQTALERLTPIVYQELRRLASRYMRGERPNHSIETGALVNEAYVRLVDYQRMQWRDRAHFFAVSAQLMRRILVDHARKHIAGKRGGGVEMLPLNEAIVFTPGRSSQIVQLDDALTRLAQTDERACRVIELRFFGGLSVEESAEVLKVSPRTVKREWMFARAWLRSEFGLSPDDNAATL
jgi:RNA polymerase sigma factor (TIGR02999 family)